MANPQVENGFFRVANELASALSQINLSPYESRLVWAIFLKTYGWHKKMDRIANSQLEKLCHLDRRHISRAKLRLISRRIVISTDDKIGINKNYEEWLGPKLEQVVISTGTVVISTDDKLSSAEAGQKKQDTNKRKKEPSKDGLKEVREQLRGKGLRV